MSIAFVFGGWMGSKMALSLPQETLRKVFGVLLIYVAFRFLHWDQAIIRFIKSLVS
jgi:uncharacterized membrane protein YfcA